MESNPNYECMKDHTEAIFIEFEPSVVTFKEILDHWSEMHSPTYKRKTQYRSAIWYMSQHQKETALAKIDQMKLGSRHGYLDDDQKEDVLSRYESLSKVLLQNPIYTDVQPPTKFYQAEEYHNNYLEKEARL